MGRKLPANDADRTRPSRRRRASDGYTVPAPASGGRSAWTRGILMFVVPVLLFATIAGGVLYVRLSQGPMSLPFLAKAIGRGLGDELGGQRQALVETAELAAVGGALSLRLKNVNVVDAGGASLMSIPQVLVGLSHRALWGGQFVPENITLLSPRLRLAQRADGKLIVTVATDETANSARSDGKPRTPDTGGDAPFRRPDRSSPQKPISFNAAELIAQMLDGGGRGSYLRSISARNAVVEVDRVGVAPVEIALQDSTLQIDDTEDGRSLSLRSVLAQAGRDMTLDVRVSRQKEHTGALLVEATFAGLERRLLVALGLAPNEAGTGDFELGGRTKLALNAAGAIDSGQATLRIRSQGSAETASGSVAAPERGAPALDAEFNVAIGDGFSRVTLLPSPVRLGDTVVNLVGAAMKAEGQDWKFVVESKDGSVRDHRAAAANREINIDAFDMRGRYDHTARRVEITEGLLRAAGASLRFQGQAFASADSSVQLAAEIEHFPIEAVAALWPSGVSEAARAWFLVNAHGLGGATGTIRFDTGAGPNIEERISAEIQLRDLVISGAQNLPQITLPLGTLSLRTGTLELVAPEGRIDVDGGAVLALTDVRYVARNAFYDDARGEAFLKVAGDVGVGMKLLARPEFSLVPPELRTASSGGELQGDLRLMLAPADTLDWKKDTRVFGSVRISSGWIKSADLPYAVSGADLITSLSEQVVDISGQVLIAGVAAQVSWQRIYAIAAGEQPPLRIAANLDGSDRRQLGIGNGAIIRDGPTPIEVTISSGEGQEALVHVDVDLTATELAIDSLSWRKPPGTRSVLRFDVAKGTDFPRRLINLKAVGQNLAVEGWAGLNEKSELVHVELPTFSLGASRLQFRASRRDADRAGRSEPPLPTWTADVSGSFYDGSNFFRSLFVADARAAASGNDQLGLDLTAKIDSVGGFNDERIRDLDLKLTKRNGKLVSVAARGQLDGGGTLDIAMRGDRGGPRKLIATSTDAGKVFRLVDFYPSARGGQMRLEVDLDGSGAAQRSGVLTVRNFEVLGDPVISEVIQLGDDGKPMFKKPPPGAKPKAIREVIQFEVMHAPFSVGYGQFVLNDAQLRGPLIGASLRGKADYVKRTLQLGGTYAPLQGINAMFSVLPGLGQLLTGPRGEGIVGMTFAVQGPMDRPEVLVNPLSLAAPGIFREIFQMSPLAPEIIRRDQPDWKPVPGAEGRPAISATPPTGVPPLPRRDDPAHDAEVIGDWSTTTVPVPGTTVTPGR